MRLERPEELIIGGQQEVIIEASTLHQVEAEFTKSREKKKSL